MRNALRALVIGLAVSAAPVLGMPAFAQVAADHAGLASAYNNQTDQDFRKGLQMRLAWTGDYAGTFDGRIGPASLRAIRDFQARHGMKADGIISEPFLRMLVSKSDEAQDAVGLGYVDDPETGARMALPLGLVEDRGRSEVGHLWRSANGGIEIELVRIAEAGQTMEGLYGILSSSTPTRTVLSAARGDDWFIVSGEDRGRAYYIRFADRGGDLRGFSASYVDAEAERIAPYVAVAANLFQPFAGEPRGALVAEAKPPLKFSDLLSPVPGGAERGEPARYAMAYADPAKPNLFELPDDRGADRAEAGVAPNFDTPPMPGFDMSGTGFLVSEDGWLLTNAHVVRACKSVLVAGHGAAVETRVDEDHDLALIRVEGALDAAPLAISEEKPRLGEDILALGFPLRSILADSLNVTRGNVSSLLGLMNDERYLQISAAVQPGNSGGPLVDLAGRVIGVVTAKLNAVAVADVTGDIPQSVNFAIRPDAAAAFLRQNAVSFTVADPAATPESVPDATARVKDAIMPVLCINN
ncbi:serine protease [Antarcticirhabdus aurantiaca]|uniref:Serine protease n=1 Tax=Antarcticirhabdus aurantiaca TaxID=2606717 RepID=A0ACD4NJK0_9HYPH|nr:serine protease [Antarcticirhabdus aurantiaca]WAJ27007.1 serine protease [Jeongeuplla avenae]